MSLLDILADLLNASKAKKPTTPPLATEMTPEQLIIAVNMERAKIGLPALVKQIVLSILAQDWAHSMAQAGKLDHGNLDGRIKHELPASQAWGEDIAAGQLTIKDVMKSWMNSPPHRKAILNPRFNKIGVGIAKSQINGQIYWCLDFDFLKD